MIYFRETSVDDNMEVDLVYFSPFLEVVSMMERMTAGMGRRIAGFFFQIYSDLIVHVWKHLT